MQQRGQVLPIVAFQFVLLLSAAALAIDIGYLRFEQRLQQTAADSAALAGASETRYTSPGYAAAAQADSASNGFTNGSNGVSVHVYKPPQSGPYMTDATAVEVLVTSTHPTFLAGVVPGVPLLNGLVTARAVARLTNNNNDCMYMLDSGTSTNMNNATINASNCQIILNGSANMNGATITASPIGYNPSAGAPNTNGASFPQATPAPAIPANNPCQTISGCAYLAANAPSTTGCTSLTLPSSPANQSINPGCYSALDVTAPSGTVTMNAGLYVINGAFNASKATVTGTGVTIYFTASGSANFDKATLTLSAPTSGNDSSVLFYSTASSAPNFNKVTNSSYTGVIYFPNASVNFNKTGGGYTVLIFGSANFNGSTSSFPTPTASGSPIKIPVLAE